ncbi:hypothetical protein DXG01_010062 [Tephrocybe rancida]|nr:hypothetical protein DXG01_010062 [Tephrocybe rancida]
MKTFDMTFYPTQTSNFKPNPLLSLASPLYPPSYLTYTHYFPSILFPRSFRVPFAFHANVIHNITCHPASLVPPPRRFHTPPGPVSARYFSLDDLHPPSAKIS